MENNNNLTGKNRFERMTPENIPVRSFGGKKNILVINGPNLNMLGIREPDIYGKASYSELERLIYEHCEKINVNVAVYQSNYEGDIVTAIQNAYGKYDGIVINPAAYTHTSVAILDAVKAVGIKTVEVHISVVDKREAFRQISYIRSACAKTISGHGFDGYIEAIDFIVGNNDERQSL